MDDERVYTLHEAAERLHMPYRSLRDAVFQDRWPHRKISQRRRLMTASDIDAVLALTARRPTLTEPPSPVDERSARDRIKAYLAS